jgi:hypothetical protein
MAENGKLVRTVDGRFVKGQSGNPAGRPKGSKNTITIQKLLVEEAFRAAESDAIAEVLQRIVQQALDGDKASQKLVWEASVSKQALAEDKQGGSKQQITVHTMNVSKDNIIEGEIVDETTEVRKDDYIEEILQ